MNCDDLRKIIFEADRINPRSTTFTLAPEIARLVIEKQLDMIENIYERVSFLESQNAALKVLMEGKEA